MMNSIAPATWQPLRSELCAALNSQKDARTLEILERTYGDADVLFVQEAASAFVKTASASLGDKYHILAPSSMDPKRDQNSLVLVKKGFGAFEEVDVLSSLSDAPVAAGDLLVVQNDDYVLASFHGDTNGLATIPITDAVLGKVGDKTLIFGLRSGTFLSRKLRLLVNSWALPANVITSHVVAASGVPNGAKISSSTLLPNWPWPRSRMTRFW